MDRIREIRDKKKKKRMISKLRSGITGHVLVPFIDMGKLGEDKVF